VDKRHQIQPQATVIYQINMQTSVYMIDSKVNVVTRRGLIPMLTLESNFNLSKYSEDHRTYYDVVN
jgi:hypothetical protein